MDIHVTHGPTPQAALAALKQIKDQPADFISMHVNCHLGMGAMGMSPHGYQH